MSHSLKQKCDAAGQGHLLHFWDKLTAAQQGELAAQVNALDLNRIASIYSLAIRTECELLANEHIGNSENAIRPLPDEAFDSIIGQPAQEAKWRSVGLAAIARGEVGVILMAGGQGTRLGSSDPKGCYDIGLPSHKSLFQLQAERIARLQTLAAQLQVPAAEHPNQAVIPWYIMTSGPTRKATELFFKQNNYFGLSARNVIFFEQGAVTLFAISCTSRSLLGTLPCLTMDGKIILDSLFHIAEAPDGNGGLYAALRGPIDSQNPSHTVISDLNTRGIRFIHTYGVDNCLVRVADPVFIGWGITKEADCAVKVVRKTQPTESVGVVARRGTSYGVIEYSEISTEQATLRDPTTGELAFRAANIANHFYTTAFLENVRRYEGELAFHIARKKIPFVDIGTAELIKPSKSNGMKLELFVFDVFPYSKKFAVLEVERTEEFSPLKNAPGTGSDDPETSRRDILAQHKRFWRSAVRRWPTKLKLSFPRLLLTPVRASVTWLGCI